MSSEFCEDWVDVWPVEPEPRCVPWLFSDWKPTDAEAQITGLDHALLTVDANEGVRLFALLLLFGTALCGLLVWLAVYIVQTESLVLIVPLVASVLLAGYCWGYILLSFRLRSLLFEIVLFCCVTPIIGLAHLVVKLGRMAKAAIRIPGWLLTKYFVVQLPRHKGVGGPTQNPRLCGPCGKIVTKSRLLNGSSAIFNLTWSVEHWQHHSSLEELQRWASCCQLCEALLRSTGSSANEPCDRGIEAKEGSVRSLTSLDSSLAKPASTYSTTSPLTLEIWKDVSWKTARGILKVRLKGIEIGTSMPLLIEEVQMPHGSWNDENWDERYTALSSRLAKEWIETCRHKHKLCHNDLRPHGDTPFSPKRLIEVSTKPTSDDNEREKGESSITVKLVDIAIPVPYMALSRSWTEGHAEDNALRLLPTNIEKLRESVAADQLGPSIQGAANFAAGIRCRYLWADRLCILPEEWEAETARFGLILSNATCTISSTRSTTKLGKSSSCVCQSSISRGEACVLLSWPSEEGRGREVPTLVVRPQTNPIEGDDNGDSNIDELFDRHVDANPFNSRQPWALQDRLLSPRLLYLCDGGLTLFECNTMRASNQDHRGMAESHLSSVSHFTSPKRSQLEAAARKWRLKANFRSGTHGMTHSYHTRKKVVDAKRGVYTFETLVLPLQIESSSELQRAGSRFRPEERL
ncbi:hypothetical protein B0H63DRAFT_196846 [Podospora didyma]|uniref:Heterokaryon incompatibility domain-containing protein n=1 Tax=Podospora didyma TaxID=330526 RepID=A0AAE0NGL5_9PEZI|nr:hypothetical protein B0H63DRAFT_196846 [Podospora didyma]